MTTVGFDFGTTNSLVSVVVTADGTDRVVDVVADDGLPYPSVVRYEGEEMLVGRQARELLDDQSVGVHGNVVRSPKFLLGRRAVEVGGIERDPIDIVADVVRFVRQEALHSSHRGALDGAERAVVTIPVTMNGPRRAALREAFGRAGVTVEQFVHEPLAALYGYLREQDNPAATLRELRGRYVLVVDWGGGTLDLTLCRVDEHQIVQLRNGGTDEIGGDRFDRAILDEVVARTMLRDELGADDEPPPAARPSLLSRVEHAKIALSERDEVSIFAPRIFPASAKSLHYRLSREELDLITKPLVDHGVRLVESLLESVGVVPAEIPLCLVVGGMAAMPVIRGRLYELFGPTRVVVPSSAGTLISRGSAWIAHDGQRLTLAKRVELEMARGSRMTILRAGTPMPTAGEEFHRDESLYCSDPTNGTAKLPIVQTVALTDHPQASDPRSTLGVLSVGVDRTAPPFVERLTIDVIVDDDLVLTAMASSHGTPQSNADRAVERFHDLEFGIGFPGLGEATAQDAPESGRNLRCAKGLVLNTNVIDRRDQSAIPGDVLYRHRRGAFDRLAFPEDRATEEQLTEHLYYEPCAVCRRPWGDPECRCARGVASRSGATPRR